MGIKFAARVCLRIREWPAGMPRRLLTRGPNAGGSGATRWWPFGSGLSSGIPGYFGGSGPAWTGSSSGSRNGGSGASSSGGSSASGGEEEAVPGEWNERHWLRPRSPLGPAPAMDISFDLVQGDFAVGGGVEWLAVVVGVGSGVVQSAPATRRAVWTVACGAVRSGVWPAGQRPRYDMRVFTTEPASAPLVPPAAGVPRPVARAGGAACGLPLVLLLVCAPAALAAGGSPACLGWLRLAWAACVCSWLNCGSWCQHAMQAKTHAISSANHVATPSCPTRSCLWRRWGWWSSEWQERYKPTLQLCGHTCKQLQPEADRAAAAGSSWQDAGAAVAAEYDMLPLPACSGSPQVSVAEVGAFALVPDKLVIAVLVPTSRTF